MNGIFFAIVLLAFLTATWQQFNWLPLVDIASPMDVLSKAMIDSAGSAVDLAIGLIGVMTLFLGLMKIAEAGGMLTIIARLIRPLMMWLFPEVPPDHPAMGAMILNISANMLGLGNAATPFGIRAMQSLDTLNRYPGTATDAMVLFLAINTSSVTILPTGIIALRAAAGSSDPAGILPSTLFATICSTAVAIIAAKTYRRFFPITDAASDTKNPNATIEPEIPTEAPSAGYPGWVSALALCALIGLIPLTILYGKQIAPWIIPGIMIFFLSFGMLRGVAVYEAFVEGAKEGFQVAIRIIPYLVAILVAVGMFRASGAMDILVSVIGPITSMVGLPAEALPMVFLRPLSGSGAYGLVASIIKDPAIGPDSYIGYLVSTLQGTTETTFYIIAVYFGAVQIRRVRHTIAAALTADLAGIIAAVAICSYLFT